MKNILLLAGLLIALSTASQGTHYSPISILDKIPGVQLGTIMNTNKQLNAQQYKGKWIILDFWNIHCGACIEAMPKLETLQGQFDKELQIVMVTRNSTAEVQRLFTRLKKRTSAIPVLTGDTILGQLFPHDAEPHHVWIDPGGIVRYIAEGHNTNAQNIQQVIAGNNIHLQLKGDLPGDDDTKPLLQYASNSSPGQTTNYSMLLQGLFFRINSSRIQFFKDSISGMYNRILALNTPLYRLYNIAFGPGLFQTEINPFVMEKNNRIIAEVKDLTAFSVTADSTRLDDWLYHNLWSYDLKMQDMDKQHLLNKMQVDLQSMLPYLSNIEKRKMRCLVLIKSSNPFVAATKDTTSQPVCEYSKGQLNIRNTNIKSSLYKMLLIVNQNAQFPIIDETGTEQSIDLDITCRLDDLPALRKQLQPYGLDLIEQEKDIDMLIVKDRNTTKL